jgi:hypothetical protein
VTRTEREEVHTGFWWGNLRESDPLEDLGADGRIMLNLMLRSGMRHGPDSSGSG